MAPSQRRGDRPFTLAAPHIQRIRPGRDLSSKMTSDRSWKVRTDSWNSLVSARHGGRLPMDEMIKKASPRALALASLCLMESLLLELTARKVLTRAEAIGLLQDAARTMATAPADGRDDWLEGSALIAAIGERYERLPASA